jgi:HNH endonuclease
MDTSQYTSKDITRFWSKVNKNGSIPAHRPGLGACWEWQAGKTKGYGTFSHNGKIVYAHRVSWELTNGFIPNDLWVLHKCDNPACVNPEHLFLGTRQDNTDDMMHKGRNRQLHGDKHPAHKLTDAQVQFIRKSYDKYRITQTELAKMMNVSQGQIHNIVKRKQRRQN